MCNSEAPQPDSTSLQEQQVLHQDWKYLDRQVNRIQLLWYTLVKQIPDALTLMRLILGIMLFGFGIVDGQAMPARDIWFLVIGWTTDMADGKIARSVRKERPLIGFRLRWPAHLNRKYIPVTGGANKTKSGSWLGRHDVYIDMLVSIAVLGYLTVTTMVPLWLPVVYLLIWSALFLRWGVPEIFAQIFQNPIYATFVFLTVRSEPAVLPWLLLWAAIALIFFWRRMAQLLTNLWGILRR